VLPTLVPKVDADGNELGGVRSVLLEAPLGTYTGWNPIGHGFFKGDIQSLGGGYIPFAKTKAQRLATGDPRLSLEERYQTHEGYVERVKAAAKRWSPSGFCWKTMPRAWWPRPTRATSSSSGGRTHGGDAMTTTRATTVHGHTGGGNTGDDIDGLRGRRARSAAEGGGTTQTAIRLVRHRPHGAQHRGEAGDDFFTFANGAWFDKFQIPADKSSYGAFNRLDDDARANVRKIIEDAAASKPAAGSVEQRSAITMRRSWTPPRSRRMVLAPSSRISTASQAVKDSAELSRLFGEPGYQSPVGAYVNSDAKDPNSYTFEVAQDGLGLRTATTT
jgi:hypothetical protein